MSLAFGRGRLAVPFEFLKALGRLDMRPIELLFRGRLEFSSERQSPRRRSLTRNDWYPTAGLARTFTIA